MKSPTIFNGKMAQFMSTHPPQIASGAFSLKPNIKSSAFFRSHRERNCCRSFNPHVSPRSFTHLKLAKLDSSILWHVFFLSPRRKRVQSEDPVRHDMWNLESQAEVVTMFECRGCKGESRTKRCSCLGEIVFPTACKPLVVMFQSKT